MSWLACFIFISFDFICQKFLNFLFDVEMLEEARKSIAVRKKRPRPHPPTFFGTSSSPKKTQIESSEESSEAGSSSLAQEDPVSKVVAGTVVPSTEAPMSETLKTM